MAIDVRVQADDFDVGAELDRLRVGKPEVGAIASFVGTVRDRNAVGSAAAEPATVATLTLEHYPGMTERSLAAICDEAFRRWALVDAVIVHRIGPLRPTDRIVLVAASSPHRDDAFDACRFLIDWLKTDAPFWKRETTPGGDRWVEARDSDREAAERWRTADAATAPDTAGTADTVDPNDAAGVAPRLVDRAKVVR